MKYLDILNAQCRDNTSPIVSLIYPYLQKNCDKVWFDESGNLFAVRGIADLYPCLVSHMDTVQEPDRNKQFKEVNGTIRGYLNGKRSGIGADDKNGIYIALNVLELTDKPIKLIFTHGEETGCIGANQIRFDDVKDVAYFLEFDRRGSSDIINYGSDDFLKIISELGNGFGYSEQHGLFTDVTCLSDMFNISAVNLSCGYYEAHTQKEYTVLPELENSLHFCAYLIDSIPLEFYELDSHPVGNSKDFNSFDSFNGYLDDEDEAYKIGTCEYCLEEDELKYYEHTGYICPDCANSFNLNTVYQDNETSYLNWL